MRTRVYKRGPSKSQKYFIKPMRYLLALIGGCIFIYAVTTSEIFEKVFFVVEHVFEIKGCEVSLLASFYHFLIICLKYMVPLMWYIMILVMIKFLENHQRVLRRGFQFADEPPREIVPNMDQFERRLAYHAHEQ